MYQSWSLMSYSNKLWMDQKQGQDLWLVPNLSWGLRNLCLKTKIYFPLAIWLIALGVNRTIRFVTGIIIIWTLQLTIKYQWWPNMISNLSSVPGGKHLVIDINILREAMVTVPLIVTLRIPKKVLLSWIVIWV